MATNFRDPRFQRALLRLQAGGPANRLGAQERLVGQFAGQQQGVQNRFAELAVQQRSFEDRMGLANRRLQFEKSTFSQRMKDARDKQRLGLIGGVITSGIAGLIGRDRRKKTEALAAEQRQFNRGIMSLLAQGAK